MLDAHVKIQGQGRGVVLLAAGVRAFEVLCQLLLRPSLFRWLLSLLLGLGILRIWNEVLLREGFIPLKDFNFYLYFVVLPESILQSLILQFEVLASLREILYFSQKLAFLGLFEGETAFRVRKLFLFAVGGRGGAVCVNGEKVSQLLHLLFNLILYLILNKKVNFPIKGQLRPSAHAERAMDLQGKSKLSQNRHLKGNLYFCLFGVWCC